MAATAVRKEKGTAVVTPVPNSNRPSAINDKAMLVGLTLRRWHPHITDKKVSDEVAETHKSDRSMGKYRKRLIGKECMAKIRTLHNRLRETHYFLTLPWSDEGYRILSQAGYIRYTTEIRKLRDEIEKEVAAFLPLYPQFKAEAKVRMNGLFNEEDYPEPSELRSKFGVEFKFKPIPMGDDFRVDVGDQELARIKMDIEADNKTIIEQAMKSVWERLASVVSHAAERLKAYEDDGEKVKNPFRDSLVTNIVELLDVIPALNITGDPVLVKYAAEIRKGLTTHSAEVLRDDARLRTDTAARAEAILTKMNAFLA